MECIIQYLDDLEDLVYTFPLMWEKIRRLCRLVFFTSASAALMSLGIYLALTNPPIAVAAGSLLLVAILYRGAVHHSPRGPAAA
jgi:hypothetical protein